MRIGALCVLGAGLGAGLAGAQEAAVADAASAVEATDEAVVEVKEAAAEAGDGDTVIVRVNDTALTEAEMQTKLDARLTALGDRIPEDQLTQLLPRVREQMIEEFVMRSLIGEAVTKAEIQVDEGEINDLVEQTKANLPPGMSFEDVLRMQGFTEAGMKEELTFQASVRKLLEAEVGDKVAVTEDEVAAYYENNKSQMSVPATVRARHILVTFGEGADEAGKEAKRAEIDAILAKLKDGADFAELAKEKSDCPSGKAGGDLGQFGRGSMVPPFEEAAFSQPVGEVGDVIETRFGYHLIEVLEKNDAGERSLDDVREELTARLSNEKRGEAFQQYVEGLRDTATIEYPSSPPAP